MDRTFSGHDATGTDGNRSVQSSDHGASTGLGMNNAIGPASYRRIGNLDVRFAESRKTGVPSLVLLSPWPETLYAFDRMWDTLTADFDVVAVDLPGIGHSDMDSSLMTPRGLGEFIVRVLDDFGFERPHVIGPDVGTAALLFATANHPDRFASITIGSGAVEIPLTVNQTLLDIILAPTLDSLASVDPRELVNGGLSTKEGHELDEEIRDDYLTAYDGTRFLESFRYLRAYPEQLPEIAERLSEIAVPTLIIAGSKDPFVFNSNATFLGEKMPNARVEIFDCGHFTWEDDAERYASTWKKFVEGL